MVSTSSAGIPFPVSMTSKRAQRSFLNSLNMCKILDLVLKEMLKEQALDKLSLQTAQQRLYLVIIHQKITNGGEMNLVINVSGISNIHTTHLLKVTNKILLMIKLIEIFHGNGKRTMKLEKFRL